MSNQNNIHLCIASVVRVIKECSIGKKAALEHICESLINSIDPVKNHELLSDGVNRDGVPSYSSAQYRSIHGSRYNLPRETVLFAQNSDPIVVRDYLVEHINNYLDDTGKKKTVRALSAIINLDEDIDSGQVIGELSKIKKKSLKTTTTVNFADFITDVFILAVPRNNDRRESLIKALDRKFYEAALNNFEQITLVEAAEINIHHIISPLSKGSFDTVFEEITASALEVEVHHAYKLFALKDIEFEMNYDALVDYLRNNLGYCILSRSHIKHREESEGSASIGLDALRFLMKIDEAELENLAGELLLHVFLERVLGAPKLMSELEVRNSGLAQSKATAVHLLSGEEGGAPFNEIVYGASLIQNNLKQAIDIALSKIAESINSQFHRTVSVEPALLMQKFPEEDANKLQDILIPKRMGHKLPNTAFGVFLGYKPSKTPKRSKGADFYKAGLRRQMETDVRKEIPFLESLIKLKGLEGYPLYIYLLPFNDADADKGHIINSILGRKGYA